MSLRDLGKRFGVHWVSIGRWERGEAVPRLKYLEKYCKAFGVRMEDLWK